MDISVIGQFLKDAKSLALKAKDFDIKKQEKLFLKLLKYEDKFRNLLLSTEDGQLAYKNFRSFILSQYTNILTARPYYRERQNTFSDGLFTALKKFNVAKLKQYHINYLFCRWILNNTNLSEPLKTKLQEIFNNIISIRQQLCINNLPLVIYRSNIFYRKTVNTLPHLEYLDLIMAGAEALLTSIDKFVPPFSDTFIMVAVYRIRLNLMLESSRTVMDFNTNEKKILYSIKKELQNGTPLEDLLNNIKNKHSVSKSKIINIIQAITYVYSLDEADKEQLWLLLPSVESTLANNELLHKIKIYWTQLPLIQQKILRLKFGLIDF